MESTQKTFIVKLQTTDTTIDRDSIREFMNNAIINSEYNGNLIYSVSENVQLLFNFLEDTMVFSQFISMLKADFLERYPYFTEEYEFCLSEFNKNPQELLINFLENTKTEELTEPYGISPEDFSSYVGEYIQNNFSEEEQQDFLKEVQERGLSVKM